MSRPLLALPGCFLAWPREGMADKTRNLMSTGIARWRAVIGRADSERR